MSSISVAGALQRDKARPTDENSEKQKRYYAPRWSLLKLPTCHRPRPLYISLYRSLGKPDETNSFLKKKASACQKKYILTPQNSNEPRKTKTIFSDSWAKGYPARPIQRK